VLSGTPDKVATKTDIVKLESRLAELETKLTWRLVTVVGINLATVGAATAYLATVISSS